MNRAHYESRRLSVRVHRTPNSSCSLFDCSGCSNCSANSKNFIIWRAARIANKPNSEQDRTPHSVRTVRTANRPNSALFERGTGTNSNTVVRTPNSSKFGLRTPNSANTCFERTPNSPNTKNFENFRGEQSEHFLFGLWWTLALRRLFSLNF